MGLAGLIVELHPAGADPVPEQTSNQIARGAAAAFNLTLFELDIEASEEPGDAVIGKAALAQDLDLAAEKVDYLCAGKSLLVRARCVTKLTSCYGDLVYGVSSRLCHVVPWCGRRE